MEHLGNIVKVDSIPDWISMCYDNNYIYIYITTSSRRGGGGGGGVGSTCLPPQLDLLGILLHQSFG